MRSQKSTRELAAVFLSVSLMAAHSYAQSPTSLPTSTGSGGAYDSENTTGTGDYPSQPAAAPTVAPGVESGTTAPAPTATATPDTTSGATMPPPTATPDGAGVSAPGRYGTPSGTDLNAPTSGTTQPSPAPGTDNSGNGSGM